jgi:hypothetical protein
LFGKENKNIEFSTGVAVGLAVENSTGDFLLLLSRID